MKRKLLSLGLFFVLIMMFSYARNYHECKVKLQYQIDSAFKNRAITWGDTMMEIKGLNHWGRFHSDAYIKKQKTRIISIDDTIEIARKYYYPNEYNEYCKRNAETILVLSNNFDICIADSMFSDLMKILNIDAKTNVELHVKDLSQMFPSGDTMCIDVPVDEILSAQKIDDGFVVGPVGIGICNHALLYGFVDIPASEIISKMNKLDSIQKIIIFFFILYAFVWYVYRKYSPLFFAYKKNVWLVGNTCVDLNKNVVYLWSGDCKPIVGNRVVLIRLLLESAPVYKLVKEDVCQKIWKRNAKDGQALYNVAISEIRTSFVAEDPALELKSTPKEGTELIIDKSKVKKWRWVHFVPILIFASIKKKSAAEMSSK